MKLIPIQYHNLRYSKIQPKIQPTIEEIAGHFDITTIKSRLYNKPQDYKFSLHTEYSAVARKLNSSIINKYPEIFKNVYNGIPKLWVSKKWAEEFTLFIIDILNGAKPKIIEIHPPTTRDISFNTFLDYYEIFKYTLEKNGLKIDPEHTIILLENRNGWNGRKFLLTYIDDFINLSKIIDCRESDLKLILDFPQLLNIHNAKSNPNRLLNVLNGINNFKHNVKAIHLWGQYNGNSHMGDMSDYFNQNQNQNQNLKNLFFNTIYNLFNKENFLYFIPEINWGVKSLGKSREQCLQNIINDLTNVGFIF